MELRLQYLRTHLFSSDAVLQNALLMPFFSPHFSYNGSYLMCCPGICLVELNET
jgi:hypothetical protein